MFLGTGFVKLAITLLGVEEESTNISSPKKAASAVSWVTKRAVRLSSIQRDENNFVKFDFNPGSRVEMAHP
ncbi:MAG: hypothetical protein J7L71_07985 [Spirochaetaceae bacterium]|nr:hypothetical protein [Spirochaetaceae bacterium]